MYHGLYIVKNKRLTENLVLGLIILINICFKCIVTITIVQVYGQNIKKCKKINKTYNNFIKLGKDLRCQ